MKNTLGIDLGTSSVKLLLRHADGRIEKAREPYEAKNPAGWLAALVRACRQMDLSCVDAVALSSQVGTYVINETDVISWSDGAGLSELHEIKARYPQEKCIKEITMPHPDIVSYPLPRLSYMKKAYPDLRSVCMPKELLVRYLTGRMVSDIYSWRGLANLDTGKYSCYFLDELGIEESILPPLCRPTDLAGVVTKEAAKETGLREGAAVYAGCNDYFAALLGTGIHQIGDLFDITGTSEHIGGITEEMLPDAPPVSGKYFVNCVRYGVTGSSGASLDYAGRLYRGAVDLKKCREKKPPLFLPYLNGERCPVCDPDARGVFFGISGNCDPELMAYAIMEGVSFSLKQILETLGVSGERIIVTGGAAQSDQLNQLKANILGITVAALDEPDASALGAAMLAGIGAGAFAGLKEAIDACVGSVRVFMPEADYDDGGRYAMYKQMYPLLKDQFAKWKEIKS